jgi:hypothetical protein
MVIDLVSVGEEDEVSIAQAANAVVKAMNFQGEVQVEYIDRYMSKSMTLFRIVIVHVLRLLV